MIRHQARTHMCCAAAGPACAGVACRDRFGPIGLRIWRALMDNGHLEQKQASISTRPSARAWPAVAGTLLTEKGGRELSRPAVEGAASCPPLPPSICPPFCPPACPQVADFAMLPKEEARQVLYRMVKAG